MKTQNEEESKSHGFAHTEGSNSNSFSEAEHARELIDKDKQTQLFEQLPIDETPFTAVKMGEHWFLTMGKYRLSQELKSYEECETEAKDASWIRIMQIINICIRESDEIQMLQSEIEGLKNQQNKPI